MSEIDLTVLIADDDEDDLFICQEALRKTNFKHRLMTAKNGRLLWDMLQVARSIPDFIVLDINMPILDGLSALALIKKDVRLGKIPVFILSTSTNPEHQKKSMSLGAKKYYVKPGSIEGFEKIFLEIVDDHLGIPQI